MRWANSAGIAAAAALSGLALGGCASHYGTATLTGGFNQADLGGGVIWVSYAGNGYTTRETVQSYWLYRCAELTLEKGYDGFRIVDGVTLTRAGPPADRGRLWKAGTGDAIAAFNNTAKPSMVGHIKLLRRPFAPEPGKAFDAAALKSFLDPYVNGKKCGSENVCPHVHRYLYPPSV